MEKYLIYDLEIKKAVPSKKEPKLVGFEYCEGWNDKENMGISCLCAYESWTGRTRVFMDDNMPEFMKSAQEADILVGFNNIAFDNAILKVNWFVDLNVKSFDLLAEIWKAAGLERTYKGESHQGFGLDACCKANGIGCKTGNGALAPIDYQRGNYGALVDYCLNDVAMTTALFNRITTERYIIDPRNHNNRLEFCDWPFTWICSKKIS